MLGPIALMIERQKESVRFAAAIANSNTAAIVTKNLPLDAEVVVTSIRPDLFSAIDSCGPALHSPLPLVGPNLLFICRGVLTFLLAPFFAVLVIVFPIPLLLTLSAVGVHAARLGALPEVRDGQ